MLVPGGGTGEIGRGTGQDAPAWPLLALGAPGGRNGLGPRRGHGDAFVSIPVPHMRSCPPTLGPTLLPGPVEDFDVLELHADPGPQRHRLGGVVLVASFDGAIGVSPEGGRSHRVTSTGPFPTSPQHPPAPPALHTAPSPLGTAPVAPVDVFLEDRHGEHVHVVAGQDDLPVLARLQVDPFDLVRPGVAPVQLPVLWGWENIPVGLGAAPSAPLAGCPGVQTTLDNPPGAPRRATMSPPAAGHGHRDPWDW